MLPIFEKLAGLSPIKKAQVSVSEVKKEVSSAKVTPDPKAQPAKPQRPAVLPPLGVSIKRTTPTPSVKKASIVPNTTTTSTPVRETVQGNVPVDIARMRLVWIDFANKQTSSVSQTLRTAIPDLQNESEVLITLDNAFQHEKVMEIQSLLLSYLRENLRNEKITITINISENLKTTKAFTPKEKLQEMMKENKDLNNLITKLGLELE